MNFDSGPVAFEAPMALKAGIAKPGPNAFGTSLMNEAWSFFFQGTEESATGCLIGVSSFVRSQILTV